MTWYKTKLKTDFAHSLGLGRWATPWTWATAVGGGWEEAFLLKKWGSAEAKKGGIWGEPSTAKLKKGVWGSYTKKGGGAAHPTA